jgi:hypothetical protein
VAGDAAAGLEQLVALLLGRGDGLGDLVNVDAVLAESSIAEIAGEHDYRGPLK